jgi:hypothetical protein
MSDKYKGNNINISFDNWERKKQSDLRALQTIAVLQINILGEGL